ncbi:DSC E3 ubiquitin ligase complex subunit 3 [Yarrowia sp. B02]|nr:DSC E3 ubiquitin ligase complex subunit 3 [Yarrowia sp. B02]
MSAPKTQDKGKSRDSSDGCSSSGSSPSSPTPSNAPIANYAAKLVIRFSNGIPDLDIDVNDVRHINVSWVKQQIRLRVGGSVTSKRLRLINQGRLLSSSTSFARDVIKVVDPENGVDGMPTIYLHCSVGDTLSEQELAEEVDEQPQRSTLPELRGFDRLRTAGFSEEEISDLRRQFRNIYGGITSDNNLEQMQNLEEEWIDNGVNAGGAPNVDLNPGGGTFAGDLIGMLMGLFLGILSIYFLQEQSLFSKRQQRAITAGLAVNFAFNVLRYLYS